VVKTATAEPKRADVRREATMLRLLADNETAIRRSGNARLMVETLLLRWAMLDRVVDLQAVLDDWLAALERPEGPDEAVLRARLAAAQAILGDRP